MRLKSYVQGTWVEGTGTPVELFHAATGDKVAETTSQGVDFRAVLDYARTAGGPRLRSLTFHDRAWMLKALAQYLTDHKEELYALSPATGATRSDSWIDIEGGIGTLFVYSSKGRRELPDGRIYIDGQPENISRGGTFMGRHICVPLEGAAVHINAFNFPCWGPLEKFAPTFLAGVPAIIKPATSTSFLTYRLVELIVRFGNTAGGSGSVDLRESWRPVRSPDVARRRYVHRFVHDRAETANSPCIVANSVRFNQETDSLNFCMLGPTSGRAAEEFSLFVKEVVREMTVKAGQKCTAIRRTLVPKGMEPEVTEALRERLRTYLPGDPTLESVRMGPLVSRDQVREVRDRFAELKQGARPICGNPEEFEVVGGDREKGAFFPAVLLQCDDPLNTSSVHDVEAFGPVNTVMAYSSVEGAIDLARMGRGSLVGSLFTSDDDVAARVVAGTAAYHGRLMLINSESAKESTGHGSPLPHLVHGGPGRAGGGEELGGIRAVLHYMQRTALQGSPTTLARASGVWMPGAKVKPAAVHPFRKHFEELEIGEGITTHRRTVTEADIVNFAAISGDHFYAHVDDIAASASIFERRVAHGYFVIAAAAGLFVDPAPGPVLANYGLDNLRFLKPVYIGDTIQVKLTCQQKTPKTEDQGVVAWSVEVTNQKAEAVASYTVLTLVRRLPARKEGIGETSDNAKRGNSPKRGYQPKSCGDSIT